ncbi:MAG: EVE domain-containing protein [Alphaproteobacteria bacterium]|nr:EVE domain-containing protein [Alphaproteobacteria bacterium]
MATWLMKSEPETWSWDDQVRKGTEPWNGVRNHQAANNMRAMKTGDRAFFYHSGEERRIVGIVAIVRPFYPDPSDETGKFGMVDVRTIGPVPTPVTLAAVKADGRFADFLLVRNSRLSVMPVSPAHWKLLCRMGGVKA